MSYVTIGARIRRARLAAGLSQVRLANLLGVTRSACSQWELDTGGTTPRADRLIEIARLLDVSYEWLATGNSTVGGDSGMHAGIQIRDGERRLQRLTAQQRELLSLFNWLSTSSQTALLKLLGDIVNTKVSSQAAMSHSLFPSEDG